MNEDTRDLVFAKINGEEKLVGRVDSETNVAQIDPEFKSEGITLVDVRVQKYEGNPSAEAKDVSDLDQPAPEGLTIETPIEPTTRREGRL